MKRDNKITVKELIELLKQFPEELPVNMDYDGREYGYCYAAVVLPVTYRPGERKEELFLLNYWESLKHYKNGRKVYFIRENELSEEEF